MDGPSIELEIGVGCCIECAVKHEYNRTMMRIMTSDALPSLEEESRFELLQEFLETADFSELRGSDPNLDGTREAHCLLSRTPDGKPHVSVPGTTNQKT